MDDISRWVNLSFVFAGLIMWWFFARISETVMGLFEVTNGHVLGENFTSATLYGLILGAIATILLRRNPRVYESGINVAKEVRKVTWPNFEETKSATRVVIITTLIIAMILASFDFVFQKLTALILGVDG